MVHEPRSRLRKPVAGRWKLLAAVLAAVAASSAPTQLHAHDSGMGLVRYNSDGSLDASFGHGGVVAERTVQGGLSPEALLIQTNGKIVLAGTSSDLATAAVGFGLAQYNADGSLDSSFGTGGRVLSKVGAATAEAHAVALQSDGDLVVAGSGFAEATAPSNFAVARYTPDGSLDPTFGTAGVALTPISASGAEARGIALQFDGRIVVAGTAFATGSTNDALALARFNSDGSRDKSFGLDGVVMTSFDSGSIPVRTAALALQPDGKVAAVGSVGGHQGAFALARYLPGGNLDSGFGPAGTGMVVSQPQGNAQVYAAAVQADGDILVAGGVGSASDSVAFALARYRPNGDLDASFGSGGFVTTTFDAGGSGAHAVTVQADGKIAVVGSGNGGFAVVRYLPNGTPDTGFGKAGVALTMVGDAGSMPAALAVQGDGKLVAAGLTYFLVPTPADPLNIVVLVLAALAVLVLVILVGVRVVRRRRIGRGLARSRSVR